jgi:hypothetical protein
VHLGRVALVVVELWVCAFDVVDIFVLVIVDHSGPQEQVNRLVVVRVKSHEGFRIYKGLYDLMCVGYIEEVIVEH